MHFCCKYHMLWFTHFFRKVLLPKIPPFYIFRVCLYHPGVVVMKASHSWHWGDQSQYSSHKLTWHCQVCWMVNTEYKTAPDIPAKNPLTLTSPSSCKPMYAFGLTFGDKMSWTDEHTTSIYGLVFLLGPHSSEAESLSRFLSLPVCFSVPTLCEDNIPRSSSH